MDGRESVGNVIHELCHVLGLYHEQCREDRDNHIIVNYDVMTSYSERYQYQKYSDRGENGYDYLNFDFNSIMLYPSQLKPDGFTMVRRDNNQPFTAQREGLSNNDILALKNKYPFERIEISKPDIPLDGIVHVTTPYTFKATNYGKNVKYNWNFKNLNLETYLINGDKSSVTLYLVLDPTLTKDGTRETYVVCVDCPELYKSGEVFVDVPDGYILTDTPRTLPQRPREKDVI
ncbi:MAG: M12 family metallopeptidase [Tannerellaceae bacterium]|nr:M12 family metallopeptidase [Tannerellaceae bacterium]